MQKRMLLALVLSLGVVMIFSYFQTPPKSVREGSGDTTPKVAENSDQSTESIPASGSDSERTADTATASEHEERVSPERIVQSSGTVPFDQHKLRGYFSLRGASLGSIKTKDYERLDQPEKLYDLVNESGRGLNVDVRFPELKLSQARFERLRTEDTRTFRFRHKADNGLVIEKTYIFHSTKPYRVDLNVELYNSSDRDIELGRISLPGKSERSFGMGVRWGPGFGKGRKQQTQFDQVYVYYGKNGEMQYQSPAGPGGLTGMLPFMGGEPDKPYKFVDGDIDWTAISNRYFIAAAVPERSFDGMFMDRRAGGDTFTNWSLHGSRSLESGAKENFNYELFMGPKHYQTMQKFQPGMEGTLNYGWFTFLTYPLLLGMRWIYFLIPNYGIAIILLSVIIKFMLYPLTKKSLESMRKMKELQPKMKEIQEKYEDDREKLNKELMEFYQEHNVNPIGGCLPMLLQLPIFIALYRMLEYTIELRGAPFALWVTDLSAKDPYYILPVLMGILMFFQQRYTMSTSATGSMGQQQQMMMYVMPVMFVVFFMNFPVGLVLYWMTNSGVTLLQYWMINQSIEQNSAES